MEHARPRKCRTLLVEDHVVSSVSLRAVLEAAGYEVFAATTLAEALGRIDWAGSIILDLRLPDGNGLELLRQLRVRGLPTPVAVTTGSLELVEEARRLRPDRLWVKPFPPDELLLWLSTACVTPAAPTGTN